MQKSGVFALATLLSGLSESELSTLLRARNTGLNAADVVELATRLLKRQPLLHARSLLSPREIKLLLELAVADSAELGDPAEYQQLRLLGLIGQNLAGEPVGLPPVTKILQQLNLPTLADQPQPLPGAGSAAASKLCDLQALLVTGDYATVRLSAAWGAHALNMSGKLLMCCYFLCELPQHRVTGVLASGRLPKELIERLCLNSDEAVFYGLLMRQIACELGDLTPAMLLELSHAERVFLYARCALHLSPLQAICAAAALHRGSEEFSPAAFPNFFSAVLPGATEKLYKDTALCARMLHELGILHRGLVTDFGAAVIAGNTDSALKLLVPLLPDTADSQLLVQPDFTIIATGPLTAQAESFLAAIAVPQQLGVASVYGISKESLLAAVASGITPGAVRQRLQNMSINPLPQPLEFMLGELAAASTLAADQQAANTTLTSTAGSAVSAGAWLACSPLNFSNTAPLGAARETAARLHAAGRFGATELLLRLAAGEGSPVLVTLKHQRKTVDMRLRPLAVTPSWLRAVDLATGSERTVSLAAIVSARAL